MAITEVTLRDELLRLPRLAIGGYSETAMLLRFNRGALWTLGSVRKVENFFSETFGRALPINASGQTATHDRLRLDHRNAIDAPLYPDSTEGERYEVIFAKRVSPLSRSETPSPGQRRALIFILAKRRQETDWRCCFEFKRNLDHCT